MMTSDDWMKLLEEAAPQMQADGWRWVPFEWVRVPRLELRDKHGRCPLCAMATLYGCSDYQGAWKWALAKAFLCQQWEAAPAGLIASAADSRGLDNPTIAAYHKRLCELFGAPKP